jgi:hypothetical protein
MAVEAQWKLFEALQLGAKEGRAACDEWTAETARAEPMPSYHDLLRSHLRCSPAS